MRGREGEWFWVDRLGIVQTIVELCPGIAIGRRAVITACDFGPRRVSDNEIRRGWRAMGDATVTTPLESDAELLSGLFSDGCEVWLFAGDDAVPDFSSWRHLAGQTNVITLAPVREEFPEPPLDWERQWLAERQAEVRFGLEHHRPMTFLRDDLVVTRDSATVRTLESLLAEARRCYCSTIGDEMVMGSSPTLFREPFELLDRRDDPPLELHRCRTCHTYWLFDGFSLPPPLAMRLGTPDRWYETDRWPARRRLIVRSHGGEEDRLCVWQGCGRFVLRGTWICAEHGRGKR